MPTSQLRGAVLVAVTFLFAAAISQAQSISGSVTDPTGAVVPNARVEIHNPVSGYDRSTTSDAGGQFSFSNVPFNPYHMVVKAQGFSPYTQDVEVRSNVPVELAVKLQVAASTTQVTVEAGGDLVENDSTFHTDVDKDLLSRTPLESQSSELSSAVTLTTPGIAADSNGLFHGLGDHAENSFSVDGQPITDQQSKVFSNQIPLEAVQSMEVISGAPPAEYGDKTSVVINVTTQSGEGVTTPHGAVTSSYGSFGTATLGFDLAYGQKNWGNFISASAMNSGRFLDPPEFEVMHDKGNEENLFDRVDFKVSNVDSIQLNFGYTRSWFQTPNTYDAQTATAWRGLDGLLPAVENYGGMVPGTNTVVGSADQRSQIQTFNIAPSWTRLISAYSVFTLGGFMRRDAFNYYPSSDRFADLGPPNLQRESVSQYRTLTNAGLRSSLSYVKGIHNVKGGAVYQQTFLNEHDQIGIVDPIFNAPCLTAATAATPNVPVPGFTDPAQCAAAGLAPNVADSTSSLFNPNAPNSLFYPAFNPVLLPYDLTRGGSIYNVAQQAPYLGHTDVKELALYLEDNITKGNWSLNLGVRGDFYNGLTTHKEGEPRLGVAYNIKPTNTILRVSYARVLETPFNENLILSSFGCNNSVLAPLLGCFEAGQPTPLAPGWRNEFHAGIEQAFGRYLVFSGEYIWKYTHNGYDFSVLGNTPITFPVEWERSKIPGFAGRVSVPDFHGFSAMMVFSSVAARFFTPQLGGAGAVPSAVLSAGSTPFRIDHDEKFNQTTHFQYQPFKSGPWLGVNWRYDSGMVAGQSPCYGGNCAQTTTLADGTTPAIALTDSFGVPLTANQEFESGLFCGSQRATPTMLIGVPGTVGSPALVCPVPQFGSTLLQVPAPNTENDDKNPPRIAHRNLFDLAVGHDNIFHGDKYKVSLQLTAINITNKYALYNFLSTFSGTHYVTPRALTAEIGFHF